MTNADVMLSLGSHSQGNRLLWVPTGSTPTPGGRSERFVYRLLSFPVVTGGTEQREKETSSGTLLPSGNKGQSVALRRLGKVTFPQAE